MLNRIFFAIVFLFTVSFTVNAATPATGYSIGDKVSDFTINNYDGNSYTLSNSGSKVTVVVFLSTKCPFVQPYSERLNSLVNEFGPQGVAFWGVNSNVTEPVADVQSHAADHKYNFPVLKDENSVVADLFTAERTPEVFVIDNSTMTLVYHGTIDDNKEADKVTNNDLKNALNEYLAGKEITNKQTKAFGCTIKRQS